MLRLYKIYSTVCPFCRVDEALRVIEVTFTATHTTVETNVPLLAEGFDVYEYIASDQKDASTNHERVRCSRCGHTTALVRLRLIESFIQVDERYKSDYEDGRHEFQISYSTEEEFEEYPMLTNYADALVMGRLAASQIYDAESYSHEIMDRSLWFFVGWMQRWTELVEI